MSDPAATDEEDDDDDADDELAPLKMRQRTLTQYHFHRFRRRRRPRRPEPATSSDDAPGASVLNDITEGPTRTRTDRPVAPADDENNADPGG